MSIFLGKPDYSAVAGFQEIQGDNLAINSTIQVTEGALIKTSQGWALAMVADAISELWKPEDFKPGTKVCFIGHTTQYTRWTKDNPKLPVEPSPIELALNEWAESEAGKQWQGKVFTGKVFLNGAESVLTAVRQRGMWDVLFDLKETEPKLLGEVKEGASGGGFRKGGGGQSEASKLADRLEFMKTQLKGLVGANCETVSDLAFALDNLDKEMPTTYSHAMFALQMLMNNGR